MSTDRLPFKNSSTDSDADSRKMVNENGDLSNLSHGSIRDRPCTLSGATYCVETGYGELYVTINAGPDGEPFELFAMIGKSGGFTHSVTEAIANLTTLALRAGVPVDDIAEDLIGIRSPRIWFKGEESVYSIPDAIGKVLHRFQHGDSTRDREDLATISDFGFSRTG